MAETRPASLDEMARITGVGAKKLESYGAAFLAVITGEASAPLHPLRRKMAGRDEGAIYDRLVEAQMRLMRGEDGTGKPLSCSPAHLAKIASARPSDLPALERIVGDKRADRFGPAFLEALRED